MTAQALTLVHTRSSETEIPSGSLTSAISTFLICDHSLMRLGLEQVLQGTPFVLAEVASAAGLGRRPHMAPEPALIIVDASQNTSRVLEVVKQVKGRFPQARTVVLADQFDLSFVQAGHEAGVNGFCLGASGPGVLVKSLELVMLGETVIPSAVLRSLMDMAPLNQCQLLQGDSAEQGLSDLKACKLSVREAEILGCLTKGEPNKVIARKLDITEATIKVHVKAILRKIGAANRTQAAMWASQRLPRSGVSDLNV